MTWKKNIITYSLLLL